MWTQHSDALPRGYWGEGGSEWTLRAWFLFLGPGSRHSLLVICSEVEKGRKDSGFPEGKAQLSGGPGVTYRPVWKAPRKPHRLLYQKPSFGGVITVIHHAHGQSTAESPCEEFLYN